MRAKQTCPHCGTRRAEWLPSEGGRRDAYEAVLDICPGCEQEQYFQSKLDQKHMPKGAFVRLKPRG